MDRNTKDVLEVVNFIKDKLEKLDEKVERLPTEDRVQEIIREEVTVIVHDEVEEALRPIHVALAQINRRLDAIEEQYGNLKGVTKEIDEIRSEVRAIQKHLGIKGKIAA